MLSFLDKIGSIQMEEKTAFKSYSRRQSIELDVTASRQTAYNWCWAAVTVSLATYYYPHLSYTQCEIAKQVFKKDNVIVDCSISPKGKAWDRPKKLSTPLTLIKIYKGYQRGHLSFSKIRKGIKNGIPCCIRFGMGGGRGHFLIIKGWRKTSEGRRFYKVIDPLLIVSELEVGKIKFSRYPSMGFWSHSYFLKPPKRLFVLSSPFKREI